MKGSKAEWRDHMRGVDRSGLSRAVVAQLAGWPPIHGVVAGYLPMKSEVDLAEILANPGVVAVVPKVESDDVMTMRRYHPGNLTLHDLGFSEPREDAEIVEARYIDVVLVPGLAFDRDGGRLGRGKGYYDRYLEGLPRSTARLGVTTDETLVDAVPMNSHDVRVDWLATESGVRWVGETLSPETARFMERAIAVGIAPRIERFPKGTRTSKDAARAVGCELGAIAKSLVFEVDGRPVLVICSGDRRVDESKLAAHFAGNKARPASRDRVHDLTGFPAGGTPVVGHDTELDTVADTALGRYRWVWSAGGTLDTVYEVTLDRLITGSRASWANISTEGRP